MVYTFGKYRFNQQKISITFFSRYEQRQLSELERCVNLDHIKLIGEIQDDVQSVLLQQQCEQRESMLPVIKLFHR